MNSIEQLLKLAGDWQGSNKLWLPPAEAPYESQATAQIAPVARGKLVSLSYTWAMENEPHEGMLLCGYEVAAEAATVAWVDSFHMDDKLLLSRGSAWDVRGSYAAEGYGEWGWRTVLEAEGETLRVLMYNISPEGVEYPAVEMALRSA